MQPDSSNSSATYPTGQILNPEVNDKPLNFKMKAEHWVTELDKTCMCKHSIGGCAMALRTITPDKISQVGDTWIIKTYSLQRASEDANQWSMTKPAANIFHILWRHGPNKTFQ